MYNKTILFVTAHILLGIAVTRFDQISTIWGWTILFCGILITIKNRNESGESHFFAGYLVGLEVLLRMTSADVFWEFGKYGIIILLGLALLVEKRTNQYPVSIIIFALLLLPAIALNESDSFSMWRQQIAFNISGPISLVIATLYFFKREFTKEEISKFFFLMIMPIVSMVIVMYYRMGDISLIEFSNNSNFQTSGEFGPNQVSTILGFGATIIGLAFILKIQIFKKNYLIFLFLMVFLGFGLLTFSRGGMISAILSLWVGWFLFFIKKRKNKFGFIIRGIIIVFLTLFMWNTLSDFTSGALANRYLSVIRQGTGLDISNRLVILQSDLEIFYDYFWLGAGLGNSTDLRKDYLLGYRSSAHTEFSRLLAEHGVLGLACIILLIMLPLSLFINTKYTNDQIFIAVLFTLTFLTMSHSAMRLAMPGFVYGLSMLRLKEES